MQNGIYKKERKSKALKELEVISATLRLLTKKRESGDISVTGRVQALIEIEKKAWMEIAEIELDPFKGEPINEQKGINRGPNERS